MVKTVKGIFIVIPNPDVSGCGILFFQRFKISLRLDESGLIEMTQIRIRIDLQKQVLN